MSDEDLAAHVHAIETPLLLRLFRGHAAARAEAQRQGTAPLLFHLRRLAAMQRELEARGVVVDVEGGLFPR